MALYEAQWVPKRKLTAYEYLRMAEKQPERTRDARFVPPKIGGKGYGHFEIGSRQGLYEVALG